MFFAMINGSLNISRNNCGKMVLRMDQISENLPYIFQHRRQPCPQQQEDAGLAKEEPHGGVREGNPGSQLP
jgi:hypothetical protein